MESKKTNKVLIKTIFLYISLSVITILMIVFIAWLFKMSLLVKESHQITAKKSLVKNQNTYDNCIKDALINKDKIKSRRDQQMYLRKTMECRRIPHKTNVEVKDGTYSK